MSLLYIIIQCTWGIIQSSIGFVIFLFNLKKHHFYYHGAVVTNWNLLSSISLGLFIFITNKQPKDKRKQNKIPDKEMLRRLLVHEYGHTIQSLIFGPFYLILIGIPSTLWGFLPSCQKKRNHGISYFDFITEKSANYLGEKITKEESPKQALI